MWTDPWLAGTAFNDSWGLLPEPLPGVSDAWLPKVTHLFISHEHPDHFHVPSLRALPEPFKQRVTLVFQKLHTDRMTSTFRKLGFADVTTMRHREPLRISPQTTLYIYQVAPLDSALAVVEAKTILNVNDAELSSYDVRTIRADLGGIHTVLNQFSFATYDGRENYPEVARREARRVLESVSNDHIGLGTQHTIPFASFMYFCSEDNRHLNAYGNRIRDVHTDFVKRNLSLIILRPGDVYDLDEPWSNEQPLAYYDSVDPTRRPVTPSTTVSAAALVQAGNELVREMHRYYPSALLWAVGSFTVHVPDLQQTFALDFGRRRFHRLDGHGSGWDIQVNSQPFLFALKTTYGLQTLSISGRFWLRCKHRRFILLRVLMALRNAEIHLRPRYLLQPRFRAFVWQNRTRLSYQFFGWFGIIRTFVADAGTRPSGTSDKPSKA